MTVTSSMRYTAIGTWLALACAALTGCDADKGAEPVRTAHVQPLQRFSLQGIAPEDVAGGFIRYEAEHFAYEVPVASADPLTATAPIYVARDGSLGGGRVHVYWVPSASPEGPSTFSADVERPTRRTDAVDLKLELQVAALPRFAYSGEPGVLVRAFNVGSLETLASAYDSLFKSVGGDVARSLYEPQRTQHAASLRAAVAALDRVRDTGAPQLLGTVTLAHGSVDAMLSRQSLTIADQIVAAFLLAERSGTWTVHGVQASPARGVSLAQQALELDLESDAKSWFPRMTDDLAASVLDHASSLASFVSHATAVVAVAGTLGIVSAGAATATAVVGAVAYCALTYAPAATATVIRAAGNLVRGDGALDGYEYDTIAPGFKHIVSQNLSYALGALEDEFAPWVNTGSKAGDALGRIATTLSGWTDKVAGPAATWLVNCVGDRSQCLKLAGDGGVSNGGAADGGTPDGGGIGLCNQAQVAGADAPETRTFDVGTSCGDLTLEYQTHSIEDAITVEYEGSVVADTGCVGGSGTLSISICGASSQVSVSVQPNCAGGSGTAWEFTLVCPM
jgi:hypothetical protein